MSENSIDSVINELFNKITQQKNEISAEEKIIGKSWTTNCLFDGTNIQTANKEKLVELTGALIQRKTNLEEVKKHLGIASYDYTPYGFTYDQWLQDFRKRYAALTIKEKKDKLEELSQRLDKLVSPEMRRAKELEQIMKELGVEKGSK